MPRKHLTRHLCGLISRSGGGGIQEDLGTVRGDRYLIAEAAQCSGKRLLAGLRQLRRVILIERNADAPVVAHGRTIATRRVTRTVTAADPLPGHLPDALDPHPPTLRYALTGESATRCGHGLTARGTLGCGPGRRRSLSLSRSRVDGDVEAEGLELAEVAADPAVAAGLLVVPAGAQVVEPGRGVGQQPVSGQLCAGHPAEAPVTLPAVSCCLSATGIRLLGHPAPAGELSLPHGRPTGPP